MSKTEASNDLSSIIASAGKSHPVRRIIFIAIAVLALIGAWFWWQKSNSQEQAGPTYVTAKLQKGDIDLTITTTGTIQPTNEVTIGSEVSGTVREVNVDINDSVTKGQQLAKLDTTLLEQSLEKSRAALRLSKANVSQATATVNESQASLARFQELNEISGGKTPSRADMENSIATLERAKANLESAEAQVAEAEADLITKETDLEKAIIVSPVDGIVLTRSIDVGQTVAAQFAAPELFIIAEDLSQMELLVNIAEADIGGVADEQNATFTVDAWPQRTYTAEVKRVSFGSLVTENVVTYETELTVSNEDFSLRPGMTATAEIAISEAKDVLMVPNAALRFDPKSAAPKEKEEAEEKSFVQSLTPSRPGRGGGSSGGGGQGGGGENRQKQGEGQTVFILKDGKPVPVSVEVGITDGRNTEVSGEGLSVGTEVIIASN